MNRLQKIVQVSARVDLPTPTYKTYAMKKISDRYTKQGFLQKFLLTRFFTLKILLFVFFCSQAALAQNVGIGTTTPQAKLDVNGQIRMCGGSPGVGKVLTSDATGIGSWMEATIHADAANFTGNGTTASPLKLAQIGASSGQVLKWNGTAWAPAADATGSSSGWTDDGSVIRLTTNTDSVQVGSVSRLGKFNVGGDIGLNLLSSIYFGSDATRITGLTGGDLRLVAEDLSMLTTEDITFGHYGDETWIKFDNANKRVGIGTLTPTDRLHVVQHDATAGLSAIKGVATPTSDSNYGVFGESMSTTGYELYGKSPKYGIYGIASGTQGRGLTGEATGTASIGVQGIAANTSSTGVWGEGSNQGVYGFSSSENGKGVFGQVTSATGYSGYYDGGKFYVSGNIGIGTTTPAKKLHVYGSAQVKDTLYANVVNATKITIMPGIAHSTVGTSFSVPTSWAVLNSATLNVPAPGYVLLMASCEFASNHTYNDVTSVTIGISKTSDGTGIKEIMYWYVSFNRASDWITDEISSQGAIQVTTSGLQTFYLMGKRQGGDGYDEVNRYKCNLTAIYFPVAYGTVE